MIKDYAGARSANWRAILINRDENPIDENKIKPADVFRNFDDLRVHFEHLPKKNANLAES